MRCVIDIEGNSLNNPTKIWLVVCRDIDTDELHIFRNLSEEGNGEKARLSDFLRTVDVLIGHNAIGYDIPVLHDHSYKTDHCTVFDTLIISKLVDYSRPQGHSIEAYGEQFGLQKIQFNDWTKYSVEMETYCIRDVDICLRIYNHFHRVIDDVSWRSSIELEHQFQLIVNSLHRSGFAFNSRRAENLLATVNKELKVLDEEILKEFPPRQVVERYFTPKLTKFGTINRTSVPRSLHDHIANYEAGKEYPLYRTVEFNPSSHKQIIGVLNDAGWQPTDRTKTHIDTERELQRARWGRSSVDSAALKEKLKTLAVTGWKVNETNLATLPATAPSPARTLAKRILLESRRRTLTEWLGLVQDDGRIHGKFYGIGAWTHRMAHQQPNTANIPTDAKLYGGEMRSLWQAPRNRLLVGVDAEGIQLRIFAHYIDDKEFTDALVNGKKSDKSDPHSLNQRILGSVCKSRNTAKRFIYAYVLGAGIGKLAEILDTDQRGGEAALDRLIHRYQGLQTLKDTVIPADARRGWFRGLDGRKVAIPGDTVGSRKHLCMSGYLQNGEAIIMKRACLFWHEEIENDSELWDLLGKGTSVSDEGYQGPLASGTIKFVDFVHDEWQTETPNRMEVAIRVATLQAASIAKAGEFYKLKCPMAGSYWNDDHKDYTIGTNWKQTH